MAQEWKGKLEKIDDYRWRLPKEGGMRVPGLIYADEKLLIDIKKEQSLNQVRNVAHLPGIIRYSMAMPDIHYGYGFCIGGVAATDIEKGVIVPGGIGYDINCLSGDAKIMCEHGYHIPLREFEKKWGDINIASTELSKSSSVITTIARFLKIKPQNQIYKLTTESGREVTATEDHPFWTPDGMIPLRELRVEDVVAVQHFTGVPYEEPSERIILSEEKIKAILLKFEKGSQGHGLEQTIIHFKKRNLLPIKYDSWQVPYILKIMGYVFGDGTVYFQGGRRKGVTLFYGKPEDLEDIRKDILNLGFTPSRVYSRLRDCKIDTYYGHYKFTHNEHMMKVVGTSFAALLISLGVPAGRKVNQKYGVPAWIFDAPLWQKRLFLASFFGAEMSTPKSIPNEYSFHSPCVSMNKRKEISGDARHFFEQVGKLLLEFGVKIQMIGEREECENKDGQISHRLRLSVCNDTKNLIRFYENVNFEYNIEKRNESNVVIQYLKMKNKVIKKRTSTAQLALTMHQSGKSPSEIYSELSSEFVNKRFLERSLYEGRDEPRIAYNFPKYSDYRKEITAGLENSIYVWDKIEKIEEVEFNDYVYDFTVTHKDHNFIANNFVVSNCGVRLLRTDLKYDDIKDKIRQLVDALFYTIPSGVGSKGSIHLTHDESEKVMVKGAKWAVDKGYGWKEDLEFTEENGAMPGANPSRVSQRAIERGLRQLGTLGAGNHFLEIQVVEEIYETNVAKIFGLEKGQITVMIHTGSRGFGYQVCDDSLGMMQRAIQKYEIGLPDRQLACAPINSQEGQDYFQAMACAANYAWANRQCIMHWTREAFEKILGKSAKLLGMKLVYDVAHNIAKFEEHNVEGNKVKVCVHRKGATRAFQAYNPAIPKEYISAGQPVIIPGDMGRNSYVLAGTPLAMEQTFGTVCFTGDTHIITNKGIISLKNIYERFNDKQEDFLVVSLNKDLKLEWKPVVRATKRMSGVAQFLVSQTGRSAMSTIKATPEHKFAILENLGLTYREAKEIVNRNEMICAIDNIPPLATRHDPKLGYLLGALASDGYVRIYGNKRHGSILFTQKKDEAKLEFINSVQKCFKEKFNLELKEKRTYRSRGIIRGKLVEGVATEFICNSKYLAEELLLKMKNLSQWVLNVDKETALQFLAGIIDGDGTFNPKHRVIDIFAGDEDLEIGKAILVACLKNRILPYVSKQRGNCFIFQISEQFNEVFKRTKRVKGEVHPRKYGVKLFAIRQLLGEMKDVKWPFSPRIDRNTFMDSVKIQKYLYQFDECAKNNFLKIINSDLRMERVKIVKELGIKDVYNIEVEDSHNYVVLTETFLPLVVKNCHGAGRVMSRHEAIRVSRGRSIVKELEGRGIIVRCAEMETLMEEIPDAYKNVNDVVNVIHNAGLSKKVAKMRPLGVIKG